jgi:hypothetical protein
MQVSSNRTSGGLHMAPIIVWRPPLALNRPCHTIDNMRQKNPINITRSRPCFVISPGPFICTNLYIFRKHPLFVFLTLSTLVERWMISHLAARRVLTRTAFQTRRTGHTQVQARAVAWALVRVALHGTATQLCPGCQLHSQRPLLPKRTQAVWDEWPQYVWLGADSTTHGYLNSLIWPDSSAVASSFPP